MNVNDLTYGDRLRLFRSIEDKKKKVERYYAGNPKVDGKTTRWVKSNKDIWNMQFNGNLDNFLDRNTSIEVRKKAFKTYNGIR